MPRIFAAMSAGHFLVVLGVAALGLYDPAADATRHIALAVFAMLLSCLVQVTGFVYLMVAGKLVAQAVHLAGLGIEPLLELGRIKARFTRHLAAVVAVIVLATATGAYQWREGLRTALHFVAAVLFLLVHVAVLFREYAMICRTRDLVAHVLAQYGPARDGASGSAAVET